MCADFFIVLNDFLNMCHNPEPTPEDIFEITNGGKISSELDVSDAYLQVKVDEECSKLLTLNTHVSLCKCIRSP